MRTSTRGSVIYSLPGRLCVVILVQRRKYTLEEPKGACYFFVVVSLRARTNTSGGASVLLVKRRKLNS